MVKYEVLKKLKQRSVKEGEPYTVEKDGKKIKRKGKPIVTFKEFDKGSTIELSKEDGVKLINQGFLKSAS